jgi:hypothetical protein
VLRYAGPDQIARRRASEIVRSAVEEVRSDDGLEAAPLHHGCALAGRPPRIVIALDWPAIAMEHVGYDLAESALKIARVLALLLEQGRELRQRRKGGGGLGFTSLRRWISLPVFHQTVIGALPSIAAPGVASLLGL